MKVREMMICSILLMSATVVLSQTNFYEQVSQLWLTGQKQAVLTIAQQRLQQNTNDIAGLMLKLEYETAFIDTTNMTNTITRVLAIGSGITTSNFVGAFPVIQMHCEILTNVLSDYTPQEIEQDRLKASITNKPMGLGEAIKALQNDGYFQ